jgi:hypothetical protein
MIGDQVTSVQYKKVCGCKVDVCAKMVEVPITRVCKMNQAFVDWNGRAIEEETCDVIM